MNIKDLVEVDPEKMSGTPVFTGTRVPISHLFDYLQAGDGLNVFLRMAINILVAYHNCSFTKA